MNPMPASPALPFEIDAAAAPPLGMSAAVFLRDYWQKRPLLIRNAFPGFASPIAPEDLAGLACEDGVLARIVAHDRGQDRWSLRTGPFAEEDFPGMPDHDWTLLVQDVDKWDADIRSLLDSFDFLPRWRLDDIMISFAAPGGSVGAHIDQYDVFLLQGLGHRRWQIDASQALGRGTPPTAFRDDAPLKLLRTFQPTHDWVLGPGDMLYLPPGVPHHGVAEDACLTYSVGMRAPSAAELLGDYADTLAADADEALRYTDADLAPPADAFEVDDAAVARALAALDAVQQRDPERLGDWFGRFMTVYRSVGDALQADPPHTPADVAEALADGAVLQRHPWTRTAWRRGAAGGARLYLAGQVHALPAADAQRLAAQQTLDAEAFAALAEDSRALVLALHAQGHYHLIADEGDQGDEDER